MRKLSKIWDFISKLSKANSEESSKRFISIYVTIFLITFVVLAYTDKSNIEFILVELIGFVVSLVGVAAWEKRNRNKYNKDEKTHNTEDS